MENRYYITKEQIRFIEHYQQMFDRVAKNIRELCSEEHSEIEWGFELGKIHSTLGDQYLSMLSTVTSIKNQEILASNKPDFDNDKE
jgi:hypothetical protein